MRNISFALTTQQVEDQTKDVTRRMGWLALKVGALLQPVKKCMGLRPGEKITPIGPPIVIQHICREPLQRMTEDLEYGRRECLREGFPDLTPAQFVAMFCATHKGCTPQTVITRIEFTYQPTN